MALGAARQNDDGSLSMGEDGAVLLYSSDEDTDCCCEDDTTYLQAYLCEDGSPTGEWKDSTTVDATKAYETTDERCVYFKGSAEPGPKADIGTLIEHATCCSCRDDTTCTNANVPSAVSVSGTFFICVDECVDPGTEPEWDNTLLLEPLPVVCAYTPDPAAYPAGMTIAGKHVDSNGYPFVAWGAGSCAWFLRVFCGEGGDSRCLWEGQGPSTPGDPTGTYTRYGGCDTTPTRTVS